MVAVSERGQNFVANGSGQRRDIVDTLFIANQIQMGRNVFKIGHIHRQGVHRDATHDGATNLSRIDVQLARQMAENTVRVAGKNRGDAAVALRDPTAAVADRLARLDVADLDDRQGQPDNRGGVFER